MNQDFLNISRLIDSYRNEMIELQRKLIEIPAISPDSGGEGEWDKMQMVKGVLKSMGTLDIKDFDAPDDRAKNGVRPNITAVIPGSNKDKTFWIMSHVDIVPPGDMRLWTKNPYEMEIEGDRLYGRGTEDNHQAIVSSIFAVKAFIDAGLTPPINIGLVIVSDEENGSKYGVRYMLKNFDIFKKDDLILVPDSGTNTGDMIEISEKTMLWLKFTTTGKQCHASVPKRGINSFKAASHLVTRLESLYTYFSKANPLFRPPISTFEPTKKEGNVPNINTIPGEDVFYLDLRILPDYKTDEVLSKIQDICAGVEKDFSVKISVETVVLDEAAPETPQDAPVVRKMKQGIAEVYKLDAYCAGIGGGTVASHFRKAGFYAAVWSKIEHIAHQPDEYCLISNMIGDTKVIAAACL